MFDSLFPKHWTTLQRLMWLKTNALARAVYETITGNPVSFTAKAAPLRQLKVAFSPIQDLHGYDSPWPAGGGKNKLSIDPSIVTKTQKGITFTVNRNSAGDVTSIVANGTAESRTYFDLGHYNISGGTILNGCPAGGGMQAYGLAIDGTAVADYGSGSTIESDLPNAWLLIVIAKDYVCNNLTFYPMIRLSSVSDATFAPYSNECPISGWSSLTVEQRGRNVLDLSSELTRLGVTYTVDADGWYTIENVTSPNLYTNHLMLPSVITGTAFILIDAERTTLLNPTIRAYKGTSVVDQGTTIHYLTFDSIGFNWSSGGGPKLTFKLQVELGSTPSAYTPYNPSSRSISISLGQTVYSGYVDVVTGVGEITHKGVDMGTGGWSTAGAAGSTSWQPSDINAYGGSASTLPHILCDTAKAVSVLDFNGSVGAEGWFVTVNANNVIYLMSPQLANMGYAQIKAALSGRQLVYGLATPIPIQLTPQEVQSLAGENVLFSDANGDLTVEYRSN